MEVYPNRGKRKDNGKWVTGFFYEDTPLYVFAEDALNIPKQYHIFVPDFADWGMPRKMVRYDVIPESVGIHVGMNVKTPSGIITPLYTGMLVNLRDSHGQRHAVEIKGPTNGVFFYGGDEHPDELLCHASDIVIIGNAFDNQTPQH